MEKFICFFSDSFEIFTAMNIKNCNHGHIILTFFDFYKIFLSPQVKQSATVSNKHDI